MQHTTLFLLQLYLQSLSTSTTITNDTNTKKGPKQTIKHSKTINNENKSRRMKYIEKLFKNGHMLTIARFSSHQCASIRKLSVEVSLLK